MGSLWPFRRFRPAAPPPALAASAAGSLAFRALLQEPRLLHRLPRPQARRLAEQADGFAVALMRSDPEVADWGMLRERAGHVSRAARRFLTLDELRGEGPEAMLASARDGRVGLGQCLHALQRDAPEVNDNAGALAVAAVLELAGDGLTLLAADQRAALMLAASRHAAGFFRGERGMPHARPGGEAEAVADALRAVDRVHAAERTLPFPAPLARAAPVRAEQATGLWRDAATCADRFGRDGAAGVGAPRWEAARDVHAFAAVLALPRVLRSLIPEERDRMAADAGRVAEKLLARPAALPGGADVRPAAERVRAVLGT